tara:strand:- start:408 stop:605 length:198 start_codon:yes stop_codon:yes gene_type:complete
MRTYYRNPTLNVNDGDGTYCAKFIIPSEDEAQEVTAFISAGGQFRTTWSMPYGSNGTLKVYPRKG